MSLCEKCENFIRVVQHPEKLYNSREIRNIQETIKSAKQCHLCNLLISVELSNAHLNTAIRLGSYQPSSYLKVNGVNQEAKIEFGGTVNVDNQISEISVSLSNSCIPHHAQLDVWHIPGGGISYTREQDCG
jgi:hypothetical protein